MSALKYTLGDWRSNDATRCTPDYPDPARPLCFGSGLDNTVPPLVLLAGGGLNILFINATKLHVALLYAYNCIAVSARKSRVIRGLADQLNNTLTILAPPRLHTTQPSIRQRFISYIKQHHRLVRGFTPQ